MGRMTGLQKRLLTRSSFVFFGVCLLLPRLISSASSPHKPKKLTWKVASTTTRQVAWSITKIAPPGTWWPNLTPDICALVAGNPHWDIPESTVEESRQGQETRTYIGEQHRLQRGVFCSYAGARYLLSRLPFYVCPEPRIRGRRAPKGKCTDKRAYYCDQWGCETTGTGWWVKGGLCAALKEQCCF